MPAEVPLPVPLPFQRRHHAVRDRAAELLEEHIRPQTVRPDRHRIRHELCIALRQHTDGFDLALYLSTHYGWFPNAALVALLDSASAFLDQAQAEICAAHGLTPPVN